MSMLRGTIVNVAVFVNLFAIHFQCVCMTIIDTTTPIVIHEDLKGRGGDHETHFGYALAYMKGDLGNPTGDLAKGTLFIGAPKENRATTNFGVVWECKFDSNTAHLSCSVLSTISNQPNRKSGCSETSQYFPEPPSHQWIGASLNVFGSSNQLSTCAPRWKINNWKTSGRTCTSETALTGACYISGRNTLTVMEPFDPISVSGKKFTKNMGLGLYTEFGYSSHVTKSETFLVGAPSTNYGKGAVIEYRNKDWNRPYYMYNENRDMSSFNELLGYSVTSGRARGNINYYAFGAPRGTNLYGFVAIVNSDSPTSKLLVTYRGTQFGSYFGYTLATVDLNGDGIDKLLVGAPMFTSDYGTTSGYSTGCVFIYDVPNSQPVEPRLCMDSRTSAGARFGSAICNLGDINFDGKEDFAVSAPYNNGGSGTVFIYFGGNRISEKPAQVIHGQSMRIRNLHGFGTYLLSGKNVDIDSNGTPDLVISSFESRNVVVLRTRPVAKASIRISFLSASSTGNRKEIFKLLPVELEFRVRVCIKFTFSVRLGSQLQLDSWLNFELDKIEKRIDFYNSKDQLRYLLSSVGENCVVKRLKVIKDISHSNNKNPILVRVHLAYNKTTLSNQHNVQHATMKLQNFHSNQQDQKYMDAYRNFDKYLPSFVTQSQLGHLEIANDYCMSDDNPECDPRLNLNFELFYELVDGTEKERWTTNKTLLIGQLDNLVILIVVSNSKETAYRPTVRVRFGVSNNFELNPSALNLDWQETPGKPGECSPPPQEERRGHDFQISKALTCARSLHVGKESKYLFVIGNLKHLKLGGKEINGNLTLKIDAFPSGHENEKKVSKSEVLPLLGNLIINTETSSSSSSGQCKIDPKRTNFVGLTQYFVVKNSGYSGTGFNKVKAEILVPSHVNVIGGYSGQVVGIVDPSSTDVQCYSAHSHIFELPNTKSVEQKTFVPPAAIINNFSGNTSTTATQTMISTQTTLSSLINSDKIITMTGCKEDRKTFPPATCQKIECSMDLPSKGSREIKLQMYLLPKALEKLVSEDTKGIRIDTIISVFYLDKKVSDDKMESTLINFIMEKFVPAWVFVAAGGGGALLFLFITLVLFQCGFFQRKRKEELKKLKRLTMHHTDESAPLNAKYEYDE